MMLYQMQLMEVCTKAFLSLSISSWICCVFEDVNEGKLLHLVAEIYTSLVVDTIRTY